MVERGSGSGNYKIYVIEDEWKNMTYYILLNTQIFSAVILEKPLNIFDILNLLKFWKIKEAFFA